MHGDAAVFKNTFLMPFYEGISVIQENFGLSLLRTKFRNSSVLLCGFCC